MSLVNQLLPQGRGSHGRGRLAPPRWAWVCAEERTRTPRGGRRPSPAETSEWLPACFDEPDGTGGARSAKRALKKRSDGCWASNYADQSLSLLQPDHGGAPENRTKESGLGHGPGQSTRPSLPELKRGPGGVTRGRLAPESESKSRERQNPGEKPQASVTEGSAELSS